MSNDKYVTREESDEAGRSVANEFKEVHKKLDYITGKLDGMAEQKTGDWQNFGIIGAILMALWNMITK